MSGGLQNGIVPAQALYLKAFTSKMSNQRDETIPVGFRVTKQQRDELQRYAHTLRIKAYREYRPQHRQGDSDNREVPDR